MLENILTFEHSSEISIGEQHFKNVMLVKPMGKLPAGTHFDFATLNLNRGKLQLGNYDQRRMSHRYGKPIKEHHDFGIALVVGEIE